MQTLHNQGAPADSQASGKVLKRLYKRILVYVCCMYTAQADNFLLLYPQMDNQLRNGCSITYTFIERRSLVRWPSFYETVYNEAFESKFPLIVPFLMFMTSRFDSLQSNCCFVKAALPWILELLTTHFKYSRGSVNDGYVQSLRALILNIYSQKCVPQINEEVEVSA